MTCCSNFGITVYGFRYCTEWVPSRLIELLVSLTAAQGFGHLPGLSSLALVVVSNCQWTSCCDAKTMTVVGAVEVGSVITEVVTSSNSMSPSLMDKLCTGLATVHGLLMCHFAFCYFTALALLLCIAYQGFPSLCFCFILLLVAS